MSHHINAFRLATGMIIVVSVRKAGITLKSTVSRDPWIVDSYEVEMVTPGTLYSGILQGGDRIFAYDETMVIADTALSTIWDASSWYVWRSDSTNKDDMIPLFADTWVADTTKYGNSELIMCRYCGRTGGIHAPHTETVTPYVHPDSTMLGPYQEDFRTLQTYFTKQVDDADYDWRENEVAKYVVTVAGVGSVEYMGIVPQYKTATVIGIVPRISFMARALAHDAKKTDTGSAESVQLVKVGHPPITMDATLAAIPFEYLDGQNGTDVPCNFISVQIVPLEHRAENDKTADMFFSFRANRPQRV